MMPPLPGPGPGPQGPPPAALLAALAGGGGAPMGAGPPPDQGPPPGAGADPLEALQQVIQDLHNLIAVLPDPEATNVATTCLSQLANVQAKMMGAQQTATDSQQAVIRQLGNAAPAY